MNTEYWEKFYSKAHTKEASKFAHWCKQWIKNKAKIIDIGCGNGRDSFYFAKNGHTVFGIDEAVKPKNGQRVKFIQQNILRFMAKRVDTFDVKYCRFFFHAVEEDVIDKLLGWCRGGLLLIEARDKKDGEFEPNHTRNLVHMPTLKRKLGQNGFTVVHEEVSRGLAPYGDFDPMIVRIVAHKDETPGK